MRPKSIEQWTIEDYKHELEAVRYQRDRYYSALTQLIESEVGRLFADITGALKS
jgi:hypothetical protein